MTGTAAASALDPQGTGGPNFVSEVPSGESEPSAATSTRMAPLRRKTCAGKVGGGLRDVDSFRNLSFESVKNGM